MAPVSDPRSMISCSFCGKSQLKVKKLIGGPGGVYICNECVQLCDEIILEGGAEETDVPSGQETSGVPGGTTRRPGITILAYEDIPAIHAYLVRVLGFREGCLVYDNAGTCVQGEVDVGDDVILLRRASAHLGLASPQTLRAANGITAIMVDDVDAHHARAVEAGAEVTQPPVDQAYAYRDYREYTVRDPEGGLWSFMRPLFDQRRARA